MNTPKHYTIVSGKGFSKYRLVVFDNALLNAGIGDYNGSTPKIVETAFLKR